MDSKIPVRTASGRITQWLDAERIEALRLPETWLIRNRRGFLKGVRLKDVTAQARPTLSGAGQCFVQHLGTSGHQCYALTGVVGSSRV
jgi:hypothetical protein